MNSAPFGAEDLQQIYQRRFEATRAYRNEVWKVLIARFFQRQVDGSAAVLDLGCGYGEFINNIACGVKYGMDLNEAAAAHLDKDVRFLQQSCASEWKLPDQSLDVVFTSNFFEHLPDKNALSLTLREAWRCLKPGGRIICLGPNIKYLPGQYWDFWDHHLPLTELSLKEALETHRFEVVQCCPRFLPYTMVNARQYPLFFVSVYLGLPWLWRFFGKQFLVLGRK
jgi:SAM-dependent methyltransferase